MTNKLAEDFKVALDEGNLLKVKHCVQQGVNIEDSIELNIHFPRKETRCYKTPLSPIMYAAAKGHLEIFNYLNDELKSKLFPKSIFGIIKNRLFSKTKERDAYLNNFSVVGRKYNLLHMAALGGNLEIVKKAADEFKCNIDKLQKLKFIDDNSADVPPIVLAVSAGHMDIIDYLLRKGARLATRSTYPGNYSYCPLTCAIINRDPAMIRFLVQRGVDINGRNHYGYTPLMVAVEHNFVEMMSYLIDLGANLEVEILGSHHPSHGNINKMYHFKNTTALHIAAMHGSKESCNILLKKGANVKAWCDMDDKDYITPLLVAVIEKQYEILELFLEYNQRTRNISVNEISRGLSFAINGNNRNSNRDMIKLLLNNGASPYLSTEEKNLPIEHAVCNRDLEALKLLYTNANATIKAPKNIQYRFYEKREDELCFKEEYDFFHKYGDKLRLFRASRIGDIDELKEILNAFDRRVYVGVNDFCKDGNTPLHFACMYGQLMVVNFLFSKHCDVHAINKTGETPLMLAIKSNKNSDLIIRALLRHGANLGIPDANNKTELMHAVEACNKNVFNLLMEMSDSINLSLRDSRGYTLFLLAAASSSYYFVNKILEEVTNVNVNEYNCNHENALMLAARHNDAELGKRLITVGVAIDGCNQNNLTAFEIALENENLDLCLSLIAARLLFLVANRQLDIDNDAIGLLLKKGAHLNQHDSRKYSLLQVATICENEDFCEYLLNKGTELTDEIEGKTNNKSKEYQYNFNDIKSHLSTLLKLASTKNKTVQAKQLLDLYDPALFKEAHKQDKYTSTTSITPQYAQTIKQSVSKKASPKSSQRKKPQKKRARKNK
jgi:ankyrin repeat protein